MAVSNKTITGILREIGEYLEMQDIPFKPRAYEKAADAIGGLEESVEEIYKKGGLKELEKIPGVGKSIAEKIAEFAKTGRLEYYEDLKKKTPVKLAEFAGIEGIGPKSIKKLYRKLNIKNVNDMEKAARAGKISRLAGFGKRSEENILRGIEFMKKSGGRAVLGFVMDDIKDMVSRLQKLPGVEKIIVAGSARRFRETIGDADILIAVKKVSGRRLIIAKIMDYFTDLPETERVYAHGETKSSIKMKSGLNVDLRVVPSDSYGAALNYFTGSKDHNVALRQIAVKKGYKLNEYGLFSVRGGRVREKIRAGRDEEGIYRVLGMDYIEPEMRENKGEIELAQKHRLPVLVEYGSLQGDLQVQTDWTDGSDSIEGMARAAMNAGLQYIAITDHTKRLAMTHGLDEKRILKQMAEIDRLNSKFKIQNSKFKILKGSECDILKDGTLDLPDKILSKLDVVGASVHSYFNLSAEDQTERIQKAMENRNVDIIFHPTGRLVNRRAPYDINMDELIRTAKRTGTIMEIDAYPDRLDLKDEHVRKCVAAGVKMSIDSDAHSPAHFSYLKYGIAQARRGWAERQDVINAWPAEKMLKFLK